jgi:hypothetical protein
LEYLLFIDDLTFQVPQWVTVWFESVEVHWKVLRELHSRQNLPESIGIRVWVMLNKSKTIKGIKSVTKNLPTKQ